jgi:hypothetical protein
VLFRVQPGRPAIGAGLPVAAAATAPLAIGLATNRLTMGARRVSRAFKVAIESERLVRAVTGMRSVLAAS